MRDETLRRTPDAPVRIIDHCTELRPHENRNYDYHWQTYPLTVDGGHAGKGILAPSAKWMLDT